MNFKLLYFSLAIQSVLTFKTTHQLKRFRFVTRILNENNLVDSNIPIQTKQTGNQPELSLGFSQFRPFLDIAQPFFQEDKIARNSLIGVIAMTFLNSGVSVAFSYISRDFYNALNTRDEGMFYEKTALFFGALVVAVPVSVYYRFLREKLAIYWREALTSRVLDKYYANRTFYVIEALQNIDNPDQRISEDIRAFTRTSLDFLITILTSIIDLFSFSAILFQIYPGLFVAILIYAGLGSLITTNLGRSLVVLNYERLQREANFRFSLIRTRENSEAIAFYDNNAQLERNGLWTLFKDVLETQLGIIIVQRNLEYFTTSYRYLVQILPSLIVAPLYFAKKVEIGSITQSYGAFNHILNDFSIIINSFEELSKFSAGLTRLNTFLNMITEGGWNMTYNKTNNIENKNNNRMFVNDRINLCFNTFGINDVTTTTSNVMPLLECKNLTVCTPDGSRILIGGIPAKSIVNNDDKSNNNHYDILKGVDLKVYSGDRVLIVGLSGTGKSSLIRAIAGLWEIGSGSVQWNIHNNNMTNIKNGPPSNIFFLPQKPYNLLGSLRQQIQYPFIEDTNGIAKNNSDAILLSILKDVNLESLVDRVGGLDVTWDWSNTLSLGEQQRLAFARVKFNNPSVVVLDEATSALDLETEERMYMLLASMNVTFISVGHRPSLLRYHTSKCVLGGPGAGIKMTTLSPTNDILINLTDVNDF